LTAVSAQAQVNLRSDRAVFFTFSQPVALPQVTLPAGKYLFRLADSQTNRSVVQIYSADGRRLHGMMMTMPTERPTASDNAEIRFMETPAGTPTPVRSYWYPGMRTGWEFIYPRSQAITIAKTSNAPVLTTAADVSGDAMQSADVVRVDPSGRNAPAEASSGDPSGVASRGEVAADVPALAEQPPPAASSTVARADQAQTRRALPQTASSTPSFLLASLLSVLGAIAVGVYRRIA
jgi:hypothetical protein